MDLDDEELEATRKFYLKEKPDYKRSLQFIKDFTDLFNKYNFYYEIDFDRIVNIIDKKTGKEIITCFEMDEDYIISGFYVNIDNTKTFITYESEKINNGWRYFYNKKLFKMYAIFN